MQKNGLKRCTRRTFIGAGVGALAAAAGVSIYGWRVEPHWLRIVEHSLPINDLPNALRDRALVQVSDLHVGQLVDRDYLLWALQEVNRLEPALTVITGDFMTCHGFEQIDSVSRLLEALKPGPLGCFAVLGNHDYTIAWTRSDVADRLSKRLAELGIQVLRNEVQTVEGLQICGIDDYWGPHFHLRSALAKIDTKLPALVLCHNPDAVDLSCWGKYRGWVLSGHTHGGQCKPPFLPPPILPVLNKRYTAGEFALSNGRRLYINCGLGYVQRIRFNVRPEITLHRLARANSDEPNAALEPRS